MRAYKFLDRDGRSPFTGTSWDPGVWVEAAAARPCFEGIHACEADALSYWLAPSLWEIELDGVIERTEHKVTATRARLGAEVSGYPAALTALAEERLWHWCGIAVDALHAAADHDLATALAGAVTVAELATFVSIADTTPARRLATIVADAAKTLNEANPVTSLFVSACAAGHVATAGVDDQARFDVGFATERSEHTARLRAALGLG
jgi:hypothetical protein